MPPRTIDNLGFDAYQRYAFDQKILEDTERKHHETPALSKQTQIDVIQPSFTSEVDLLLQTKQKNGAWAIFAPPTGYSEPKPRFFTYEILPSLAKDPSLIEKVEKEGDDAQGQQHTTEEEWELAQKKEEQQKEKETITRLFHCIIKLDKCMLDVNTKRMQYHKG